MNSHSLLVILGYFFISLCVFMTNATNDLQPGTPGSSVRGSGKPPVTPDPKPKPPAAPGVVPKPPAAPGVVPKPPTAPGVVPKPPTAPGVVPKPPAAPGIVPEAPNSEGPVKPVEPTENEREETAETAKDEAIAQATEAAAQEKKATEGYNSMVKEKEELDKHKTAAVASEVKGKESLEKAKAATTGKEALDAANIAHEEALKIIASIDFMTPKIPLIEAKVGEIDEATKAANEAAKKAKERAEKSDELDKDPLKPHATIAKEKAAEAEASAKAADKSLASSKEILENLQVILTDIKALEVKSTGYAKEAYKIAKEKGAIFEDPYEEKVIITPPKLNFVIDGKYDYEDQLLLIDRCSEDDRKRIGCKEFSNCYLDHGKAICVCFPGYHTDDATAANCVKVDSGTCKNKANTCHRNADCKEDPIMGVGCQCKTAFAGDGLLCSSAFNYFMNLFLVLTLISVQLYL